MLVQGFIPLKMNRSTYWPANSKSFTSFDITPEKSCHILTQSYDSAVRAGMVFLRNGASAVDAVEMAIATLEDAPITNAGYGSNLTAKGVVEGDASIVDHFGRSGAVGAVPSKTDF